MRNDALYGTLWFFVRLIVNAKCDFVITSGVSHLIYFCDIKTVDIFGTAPDCFCDRSEVVLLQLTKVW